MELIKVYWSLHPTKMVKLNSEGTTIGNAGFSRRGRVIKSYQAKELYAFVYFSGMQTNMWEKAKAA